MRVTDFFSIKAKKSPCFASKRHLSKKKKAYLRPQIIKIRIMKNRMKFFLFFFLACTFISAAQGPKQRLIVAQDGSGDYTSIQEAIYAIRDYTPIPITVFIKNGTYNEKVIIPTWKCDITLTGESADSTIITFGDYAGKEIVYFGDSITKMGTFRTHTMLVAGHRITLENLTIENNAGRVGQAVALHTEGDQIIVRNCRLKGNQDTLFTGDEKSHVYFENCYIDGTTDFIFGPAICWFENCQIHSKQNSYITAASTAAESPFGYVFHNCTLTAENDVNKVYLGRPWRAYAAVVFMECDLGKHIRYEGWENWRNPENEKTARYAEYHNSGEGAGIEKRVDWCRQLSKKEARKYTRKNVLGGDWWQNR